MSEPVAKYRPMIDLDEFERRLRQPPAAPRRPNEDPLAELARLVHKQDDPYEDVFQDFQADQAQERQAQDRFTADQRPAPAAPQRAMPEPPRMPSATPLNVGRGFQAERRMPQAPNVQQAQPAQETSLRAFRGPGPNAGYENPGIADPAAAHSGLGGSFAAIEAGLRGSLQPDFRQSDFRVPVAESPTRQYQPPMPPPMEEDDDHWLDEAQAPSLQSDVPMHEPARSHRLLYLTAAVILLGMGGIGATFAIKRSPASPQQIAMIKASTKPDKVQAPAAADSNQTAMQDASVLDQAPQPAPTGVVNRVEQPVDLAVSGPQAKAPEAGTASSVPVPTPPTEAAPWQASPAGTGPQQVADANPGQAFGLDGMIKSHKVKTVSVRPDGSVAGDPAGPTQTAEPSVTSSPTAAPKAMSRATPPQPTKVASSDPSLAGTGAVITPTSKPRAATRVKTERVAAVESTPTASAVADTPSEGGGGFAVQFAAAPSPAEAESAVNRLARQYQGVLGGHKLKYHHAKVGEKSVYRVRVGGLSKGGAVQLCEALKAKGGSCFIAHD